MSARAPKRLNVRELLRPEDAELFTQIAADKGLTRVVLLRQILDAEAERSRHILRSRPKREQNVGQIGVQKGSKRGRIGPQVRSLEAIFDRLRVTYGHEFDTLLGGVYREFERIVQSGDGAALNDFEKACPWLVNTHLKAP